MDGIDEIIKLFVRNGGTYIFNKMDVLEISDINRVKSKGIIELDKNKTWRLTEKGWGISDSGKSWREWKEPSSPPNIHIGHNFSDSVSEKSDFSINSFNSSEVKETKHAIWERIIKFVSENVIKILISLILSFIAAYFGNII